MSNCNNDNCSGGQTGTQTIANAMQSIGPRTVEGDQGRVSMHSVHDAIAAIEYERKRCTLPNKKAFNNALRTISGHRLATHDGRAS